MNRWIKTIFFLTIFISFYNYLKATPNQLILDSLSNIKSKTVSLIRAGNYQDAINLINEGLKLNESSQIDSIEAQLLYNLGLCFFYQEKYITSVNSYKKALVITEKSNSLNGLQIKTLWGMGLSYKKLGNYIEAIKQVDKAINLAGENEVLKANLFINAGNLHEQLKQYELAIEANKNAYNIYEKEGDTLRMSMALNNIGVSYNTLEKYSEALNYFSQALKLKRSIKNNKKIASTLNNIGDLYLTIGEYVKAEKYLREALKIRETLKSKDDLASSLNKMGNLYLSQKKIQLSKTYIQRAKSLLDSTNFQSEKLENLYLFSKLYYLQGNNKKGDEYHLKYTNLNDSLYNELDVSQSILKSEREKLEAEKERAILAADKKVLEQKNKFQQYQIWSSLIIIVALAGLGWNLHRSRNMKKRLAEELSHRTNNNFQLFMSMLGYQKSRFSADTEKQKLLGEIQNRLSAMASVHKLLKPQQTLYKVNMQEYMDKILTSICYSFGYSNECLSLVVPPIELSMKRANYVGFIANEVATNALKYAFPQSDKPELHVIMSQENDKITLFMQDNGKEIPPHDPNISTSLGMTLIEDFTYNLKGKSHFEHTGEGMLFQLEFSI
ncbi:MAG: tetratricopeptide repeat-containing sensor histidine kinase [Flammeovirgaceae bacterium]